MSLGPRFACCAFHEHEFLLGIFSRPLRLRSVHACTAKVDVFSPKCRFNLETRFSRNVRSSFLWPLLSGLKRSRQIVFDNGDDAAIMGGSTFPSPAVRTCVPSKLFS